MNTHNVPLCKDCKHRDFHQTTSKDYCVRKHRTVIEPCLVRGQKIYEVLSFVPAQEERHSLMPWRCGRKARYFTPINDPT